MIIASVMIEEPHTEGDSAQVHFVDLDPVRALARFADACRAHAYADLVRRLGHEAETAARESERAAAAWFPGPPPPPTEYRQKLFEAVGLDRPVTPSQLDIYLRTARAVQCLTAAAAEWVVKRAKGMEPGDACEPSFLWFRLVRIPADEPQPKE